MLSKNKEIWIQDSVRGKSFADIGGLWGTVNEMVSHAHAGGAKRLMMADIQLKNSELWKAFRDHCVIKGVNTKVEELVFDLTAQDAPKKIGKFDVVHCSGIIYHVPDPFGLVMNLRKITNEHLVLTSMYVPEQISNKAGSINLSGGQTLFVPALSGKTKEIISAHFDSLSLKVGGLNQKEVYDLVKPNLTVDMGPWWWLLTPEYLRSILKLCRFEVVEEGDSWANRSYTFVCRAI